MIKVVSIIVPFFLTLTWCILFHLAFIVTLPTCDLFLIESKALFLHCSQAKFAPRKQTQNFFLS